MTTIAVNEFFGPTVQGEGPSIGQPAVFLRLAGCNLACVWCDTPYSWDYTRFDRDTEVHKMSPRTVADELRKLLPEAVHTWPLLVVSGGEPMLQQDALADMLTWLPPVRLEIETAGTRIPTEALERWRPSYNVSLKLAHSLNPLGKRLVPDAIRALLHTGRARWKFVAQQPSDIDEVRALVNEYGLARDPIYIMPEGTTAEGLEDRARHLAPAVIAAGYILTPRLHIELWGLARGH